MMIVDWFYTAHAVKEWFNNEDGVAAIEAGLLFPIHILLLMGVYDVGNGVILNGRTISASQVVSDLLCREKTVDTAKLNDVIVAAQLVYQPFDLNGFGIDIVSVKFDSQRKPQILWRETRDMAPNNEAVSNVDNVGAPGDGMVIVSVRYTYSPLFSKHFTDDINMMEVSYARGRRSPTVTWGG